MALQPLFIRGWKQLSAYPRRVAYDQWAAYLPEEPKLSRVEATDRETGGAMLSVTGILCCLFIRFSHIFLLSL